MGGRDSEVGLEAVMTEVVTGVIYKLYNIWLYTGYIQVIYGYTMLYHNIQVYIYVVISYGMNGYIRLYPGMKLNVNLTAIYGYDMLLLYRLFLAIYGYVVMIGLYSL